MGEGEYHRGFVVPIRIDEVRIWRSPALVFFRPCFFRCGQSLQ
jgi:hypothetical protein